MLLKNISDKTADHAFATTLFVSLWWLFYTHYAEFYESNFSIKACMVDSAMDALLITLPYFFTRKRMVWLVFPALTILFEVNRIYYRCFANLPVVSCLNTGAFNSFTFTGAADAFRVSDLIMIMGPMSLVVLSWVLLGGKRICRHTTDTRMKAAAIALFVLLPFLRFGWSMHRRYMWESKMPDFALSTFIEDIRPLCTSHHASTIDEIFDKGFAGYICKNLSSLNHTALSLDKDEEAMIEKILSGRKPGRPLSMNRGKNLVLIIVESLNSSAISKEITPFMAELIESDDVIYASSLLSQADVGRSSDGQLILNTGLLPLRGEPYAANYAHADYPSLAKSIKAEMSVEIIGESSKLWNHGITSKSFGYDRLCDGAATGDIDADAEILDFAARLTDSIPRPFFMEITTLTMHDPYNVAKTTKQLSGLKSTDKRAVNYLQATAHFDDALKDFIDALKRKNLYDSTVIAITGDHAAMASAMAPELVSTTVPLIILNAGAGKIITDMREQADVFPTLLDVMGAYIHTYIHTYRGVGTSLLAEGNDYEGCDDGCWLASEQIIRSKTPEKFCH